MISRIKSKLACLTPWQITVVVLLTLITAVGAAMLACWFAERNKRNA